MARVKLTDAVARKLAGPTDGKSAYKIHYDAVVRGFGLRVTRRSVDDSGEVGGEAKSFVLNYRCHGVERRLTIGSFPDWSTTQAREQAKSLKRRIDMGEDPQAERTAARRAPTINDLCDRYIAEHLPSLRESSRFEILSLIKRIRPELGNRKVADLRRADIERFHRKVSNAGAPVRANRLVALLSAMFNRAIAWDIVAANPAKTVKKNREESRQRYLSGDELGRLTQALAAFSDRRVTDAVRLLLLTGARKGELFSAQWSQIDFTEGVWTKPSASTKTGRTHRVPLSAPAMQVLSEIKEAQASAPSPFVFPWPTRSGHLEEIHRRWAIITADAAIAGLRPHDLRHSFASELVSAGFSLPLIGQLLGHSRPDTTARYSHLYDEAQRVAVERVGARISGNSDGPEAEVIALSQRR
jgi:integrase